MDALQVSSVMPATRDAPEQTADTAPLNPLASEFVPSVGGATAALDPIAREFVPRWGYPAAVVTPLQLYYPAAVMSPPELYYPAAEGTPLGFYYPVAVGTPPELYYPAAVVTPPEVYYPAAVVTPPELYYPPAVINTGNAIPQMTRRSRISNYSQYGRSRFSQRVQRMNKEEFLRKTIYITNIDKTVTEQMLVKHFGTCGIIVDCRLCGDPSSGFRFAFVEFQYQENAFDALKLDGAILRYSHLKVAPSRTAIMPIKHSFLPQSEEEKERTSRTVYCSNIPKTVTLAELKDFCQKYFGSVSRVRLMGHDNHATQIAFIEFTEASSAIFVLTARSNDLYVKGISLRVSPSKTPIRGSIYDMPGRDN